MMLLRSLLFQAYFFISVLLSAAIVTVCGVLPYRVRFAVARTWSRSMLRAGKVICGLDYVVEGRENLPDEPSVILIKHSTVFEAYAQLVVFPAQTWVVKRELMWIPVFGWGLAMLKPIAINRAAGSTAVAQVIEKGKQRLAEGLWVTIFPEGTRMPPGTTRKYGISGAALAKEARCLIVPVAHNAGDFWPRRSVLKRPGRIRFCIGPPIVAGDRTPRKINLEVQAWIQSKMAEIETRRIPGDTDSS